MRQIDLPKDEVAFHKYNLKNRLLNNYSSIKKGGELKTMNKKIIKLTTLGFSVLALFVGFGLFKQTAKITVPGTNKVSINLNPQVQAQELTKDILAEIGKLSSEEKEQLEQKTQRKMDDVQISLQEALKASDLRIMTLEEYHNRDKEMESTGTFISVSNKDSKKEDISKFIAYTDESSKKEILVGIDQQNVPIYWETLSR